MSGEQRRQRFSSRRAGAGLRVIAGYASSMVLLAASSLVAIPAMVGASGATAWGMIAVGQSIGGVAAVVIAFGWGLSGPAAIARMNPTARKTEYAESVIAKIVLAIPIAAAGLGIAWFIAGDLGLFAGVGALSMASVGLTANWYFIGLGQPYRLLLLETVPRVSGTAIGIGAMISGSSAVVGVVWQLMGMLTAFLLCSLWILSPWRRREFKAIRRRPTLAVLGSQRHGIVSSVVSSLYSSLPIIIVSAVAPIAQPSYAVVEKVQRQVIVGLGPLVTFLQGWVPRGAPEAVTSRIRAGLIGSSVFSLILGLGMLLVAPKLISWLGNGQISPSFLTLVLMSVITSVSLFESVVSKACLAAIGRLDIVARFTAIGSLVGLPLVALGALLGGASGALGGILVGLAVRVVLELFGLRTAAKVRGTASPTHPENSSVEVEGSP